MAENKPRPENTPKRPANKVRSKEAELPDDDTEVEESGSNAILAFFKDRRFQLSCGIFIMIFSVCLLIAFTSYLFTGTNDQSVVEALWNTSVEDSGKEVENVLGIVGAFSSYWFMYRWLGIAAYLLLPLFFMIGFRIVYLSSPFRLYLLTRIVLFFSLWLSVSMGYILLQWDSGTGASYWSGAIGHYSAAYLNNMLGIATPIVLLFALAAYLIYYFNITSLELLQHTTSSSTIDPVSIDTEKSDTQMEEEAIIEVREVVQPASNNKGDRVPLEMEVNSRIEPEVEEVEEEIEEEEELEEMEEEEEDIEEEIELPSFVVEETPSKEDLPDESLKNFNYDPKLDLSSYKYPGLDLMNEYDGTKVQVTKEELEANKDKIVETLSHYNISIASIKATIGPTVTLYEIVPDAGIRISKIKNLEDDIALSLAALGIRIIAPIPGKGTIGIEVPNKNKEMVSMRSVLSTEKFMKSEKELPIVFGKTITNEVFLADLAELPHLLIAGATGQGKSVGLNVLLASLLYKKHPSQLKLVMVDPKKVELTLYNKIERHFLAKLPDGEEAIITDTKKVINTLNSLCIEMDLRYDLLKDAQCRNIREYNKKFVERRLNPTNGHRFLPYIVLVIDELADLMMTAGKEIETPIARLAQLARAIGIHLVVATQRPSVNVITGIIKANFPARLSFKVSSKIDSRTILDAGGAEQLIGKGDMLFSHGSELVRIQCAFLDTPEVERVCEFIGNQRGYDMAYKLPEYIDDESGEEKGDFDFSQRDNLFEEAARVIVLHQQGSTSLLQRKLKLGYNRAGRLIDQLESAGIVGPFEGSKAREVLVKDEYSLELLLKTLDS
ncbi:MAG: DNA translocase FtsK [Cytophagaceae bacterium]|jgi:S-DNA-T family DNA segregation ATPase FtsK/SpoIIIE|nr:DNA translocase FtsK [Cytophagaceae bacterium]